MREAQPDIVFHLAAQPLVLAGYREPFGNVRYERDGHRESPGGDSLFPDDPAVVIVVTSDKCYANREVVWGYREDDPLGGADPYSASKAAARDRRGSLRTFPSSTAPSLEHHTGIRMATVRAGNVIGGGDWAPNRLTPGHRLFVRLAAKERDQDPKSQPRCAPGSTCSEPLAGLLDPRWRRLLRGSREHAKPTGAMEFRPSELATRIPSAAIVVLETFAPPGGDGDQWDEMPDPRTRRTRQASCASASISGPSRCFPGSSRPGSTDEVIVRTASWYRR